MGKAFDDVEIIGMLKSYVKASLVGMGALKGASCQILSIVDNAGEHVITFKWEDNDGVSHTDTLTVLDGAKGETGATGAQGEPGATGATGAAGFSPTITEKVSTASQYILTITTASGSYDTPNLKGGGSSGASRVSQLEDVALVDLATGDILVYDSVDAEWKNSNVLSSKVDSISVNGVSQTITSGATDLDIASNLITEAQWTEIQALLV